MASDTPRLEPDDVRLLARLAGLPLLDEDLDLLAEALSAQLQFTGEMAGVETRSVPSAMTFDPRWHG